MNGDACTRVDKDASIRYLSADDSKRLCLGSLVDVSVVECVSILHHRMPFDIQGVKQGVFSFVDL